MKKNTARSKSTRNKIEQYLKKRATEYEKENGKIEIEK